jgi:hypothetical protein
MEARKVTAKGMLAQMAVRHYWPREARALTEYEMDTLVADVVDIMESEGRQHHDAVRTLAHRVGLGNLRSYIDTLVAGRRRKEARDATSKG